jgi:hypothetical protein
MIPADYSNTGFFYPRFPVLSAINDVAFADKCFSIKNGIAFPARFRLPTVLRVSGGWELLSGPNQRRLQYSVPSNP